jgi:FkbM family methyltransferase
MYMEHYTQFHGEVLENKHVDAILRNYFPDYSYKGVFIDVGAFEPIRISNSYHFEKNNWDVYCFEANSNSIPLLKQYRKNVFNYAIYDKDEDNIEFNVVESNGWTAGFSAIELSDEISNIFKCENKIITKITVNQRTLNSLLQTELNNVKNIDILKIDIEGGELKCLHGIDFNTHRPKLILLENITNDKRITDFLNANGYILHKQVSYNQFYINRKYL